MQIDARYSIGKVGGNPHRYPMVLVDRVIKDSDEIITEKFISLNDYEFRLSEFKSDSEFIYPGWLVIESFFQSAGLFLHCADTGRELFPYVISCKHVAVRRDIYAGEIVRHHVFLEARKDSFIIVSGESKINEEVVISYKQILVGFQ